MDPLSLGGIIGSVMVASVAAIAAYASQRAASKALTTNVSSTSRTDMEKEAYIRARAFDIETITRQDTKIDELERDLAALRIEKDNENRELRAENRQLRLELEAIRRNQEGSKS